MEIRSKKILVISPHADDMELGCGATIARLVKRANRVTNMILSFPPLVKEEKIREEISNAQNWIAHNETIFATYVTGSGIIFNGRDNDFALCRHVIRDYLWGYNRGNQPDVIFVPCTKDVHQSHQVVTEEARRIFKHSTILGYELFWNNYGFDNNVFIEVKEEDLEAKSKACAAYSSQFSRDMFARPWVEDLARIRGIQAGVPFAESFEAIRIVI